MGIVAGWNRLRGFACMNDSKPIQWSVKSGKARNGGRPHGDYRVLLVYPNIQQCALMPYSIGLFTALLKQEGFQVGLFDSTFYLNDIKANYTHYQTYVKSF